MSKAKILIIDDDQDINNLFKTYLEHDGYEVYSYTDPIEALYYFKKSKYDLILLDLKMPEMNGIILYHALKKIDEEVSICLITADISYLEQLKRTIPNIEKFVIYKPIFLKNLKEKVEALIMERRI
ncbi:MAG: putative signal transduction response regulator, receiver domain protein [Nitrososphaeraceae archaeon]|jgi:DNA-binding response OmpR family regulator|nr:putative signal transduction response regulator, receiver domain protein [Nitrososphaeraceae archaeon]